MNYSILRQIRIFFLVLVAVLAAFPAAAQLVPYTVNPPCRLFDSRTDSTHVPPDNPVLDQGVIYTIPVVGVCGVPAGAKTVTLNVKVIGPTGSGELVVFPAGTTPPSVGGMPFGPGQTTSLFQFVNLGTGAEAGKLSFLATIAPPPPTPNYKIAIDIAAYYLNVAPTLTAGGTLAYTENDAPTAIDTTITVADTDDTNLQSATVQITGNYVNGEDVLSFVDTANITGVFSALTGTLTLTGSDTLANWETALRSVLYENTSDGPSTAARTVTWIVNDGVSNSTPDPDTSTINVTAVNDAPAGTDNTVATGEDTDYVFAAADFGFTDPLDNPANALLAVQITTLPALGSLTLSGGAVTAGQSIAVADITGGNLKFTPAANGNGSPYASFTFQVQDDGGTANGGVDLDPSANTLSVNVTGVNNPPAGTDGAVSTPEDTQYTFAAADFGFTDPLDTPANNLASVIITTLPGAGSLTLSGSGFAAGTEIAVADITAGNLKFTPATDAVASPYTTFTFQVRDDGGTAGGGVDLDASPNTLTVNVTGVNDAPAGTDNAVSTAEDVQYTFAAADFGFTDPNDTPANALASVVITTLPGAGTLTLSGSGFVAGTDIAVADITAGNLKFTPAADATGSPYTSFTFQVRDDGGTAGGGVDLDPTPNTMTVNVTAVNDAPVVTATGGITPFTEAGGAVVVDAGVTVTDVDSANLASATVVITNPQDGASEVLGATACAGLTVTPGLNSLSITGSATLAAYQTCLQSVTYDNSSLNPGTTPRVISFVANDGTDGSAPANKTVSVAAVDSPPTAVADAATVNEDSGANAINVLANDTDPDGGAISITSVTQPANGAVAITGGGTGLTYAPNANYCNNPPGTTLDTFTYTLTPGGSSTTVTMTVTCIDDDPTAVADAATVNEDSGANAVDVLANDTDPDGGAISITSVTQPANGAVVITGGGTGLTYAPNANYCNNPPGTTLDTFTYTLTPGGSSTTVTMTVTCVDDDPTAVADAATVNEDSGANAVDVLANDTDPDGGAISITSVTQPANGAVVITGGGTGLTYAPNANYCNNPPGTTLDTFTYTLTPGGSSTTVTMTVTCVDDPPVAVDDSATVTEDDPATAIPVLTNDTDIDGGPKTIASATDPANGTVVLTGGSPGAHTGLTYQPDANYCNNPPGTFDTFSYTLNGGSSATVSMTVTCVNDAPTFGDPSIEYTTVGNTQLRVGEAATGASVVHIRDNLDVAEKSTPADIDGPAPPFLYSLGTAPLNGQATVNSDGTFTYEPNPGFAGPTDSFTVNVSDGGVPAGVSAVTVTVTISEMVWYVHDVVAPTNPDNPAAGDDGRSTNAFEVLQDAVNAAGQDDYVFVFRGNTGTTPHAPATLTNKDGLKLHGEGFGLSVPGFPGLVAAGSRAVVQNAAVTGAEDNGLQVTINAGTVDGVEIRGLEITATDNAIDVTVTGAATAGVTISHNGIGTGALEGIDVNHGSTSTTSTLAIHDNVLLTGGNAIDVTRTAGTLKISAFDDNVVSGDTTGSGIVVTGPNISFDSIPGTAALDAVSGGNTFIGVAGNPVANTGLVLNQVSGSLSFSDLDIYAGASGLFVLGTGAFTGAVGTNIQVPPAAPDGSGTATIVAGSGPAVDISTVTADLRLASLTSSATTSRGVSLTNVSDGTNNAFFSAPSGSSIAAASGTGPVFSVSGGNAKITYGGTITNNGTGRAVSITTWAGDDTGDDLLLSGAIDENGGGILVNGNGGTRAITFSGGMDIDTTTGEGFAATSNTNSLGLHITGTNTIDSVSATALRVTSTTIGSSNLNFRSISSGNNTAAADPANGIVLSNTGSTGGLIVTGNGGACTEGSSTCTGGWIQNMTGGDDSGATPGGTGIVLNNTSNVSLTRMRINDTSNYGIRGTSVSGFTFTNGVVDGAHGTNVSTPFNEGSLVFFGVTGTSSGMTGTSSITNSTIMGGRQRNIAIDNSVGTLNLTVSGNTIKRTSDAAGDDGFFLEADTSANVTLGVTNNTFARHGGDHVNVTMLNNAVVDVTITGNTLHGNYTGTPEGNHPIGLTQGIFLFGATFNGTCTYEISNNGTVAVPFRGNRQGGAIHVNKGSGTGTFSGSIENNVIGDPAVTGSGSSEAFGIIVGARGTGSHTTLINNNLVRQYFDRGVVLEAGEGSATFNATVTNNTVSNFADAVNSLHGIHSDNGILVGDTNAVCLQISGNSVATAGNEPAGGADIRLRRGSSTTVRLPGVAGATNADATNLLQANNPTATTITVTGNGFSSGAACPLP